MAKRVTGLEYQVGRVTMMTFLVIDLVGNSGAGCDHGSEISRGMMIKSDEESDADKANDESDGEDADQSDNGSDFETAESDADARLLQKEGES